MVEVNFEQTSVNPQTLRFEQWELIVYPVSAPEIPYKEEYFYNYYDYNPSIGALQFNDPGVPKLYAGYPTKEIDDAWNELLEGL